MINLPDLAEKLQAAGVMNKSFMDMTKSEIMALVEAVFSSVGDSIPPDGWEKPFINDAGCLVVPADVHPDYRWWQSGSKSICEILEELEAPYSVAKKYLTGGGIGTPMTEEAWNKKLLPF